MAEGTRLNQLQDGLTALKKSTNSQYHNLKTELLASKRQTDSTVQEIDLIIELQKKNQNAGSNAESLSGV